MIKLTDYPDIIKRIGIENLNATQREGHEFLVEGTDNFTNWQQMEQLMEDADIRETVEMYLEQIEKLDRKPEPKSESQPEPEPEPTKNKPKKPAPVRKIKSKQQPKSEPEPEPAQAANQLNKIPPAVAFINRYVALHGRNSYVRRRRGEKGKSLLSLLNGLQKAIKEQVIRKTDKYAAEIMQMQQALVNAVNKNKGYGQIDVKVDNYEHYLQIAREYGLLPIMSLINRFLKIQGKENVKKEAANLVKAINVALENSRVLQNDVDTMLQALTDYIGDKTDYIKISEQALNGLAGIAGYRHTAKGWKQRKSKKVKREGHKPKKALAGSLNHVIEFDGKEASYQVYDNGKLLYEITGHIKSYNSGRAKEYNFEPGWFADQSDEDYYDKHWEKIEREIIKAWNDHVSKSKGVNQQLKKGIAGVDSSIPATREISLPEIEPVDADSLPQVISSEKLANLQFHKAGFKGKWLKLIGDPVEPFSMMIWSKPGKGKSSLAIEFAHYLASEHGRKVLYISKDEGNNSYTMQEKFERIGAFHPNIFLSNGTIPDDLSEYDYVVFDLMNDFNFDYNDFKFNYIEKYRKHGVSFISIFKSTVDGQYRGNKDWANMFDVTIYINDEGFAQSEKNRFGAFGVINFIKGNNSEKIYRFSQLQDASKYKQRLLASEGIAMQIVSGNDGKYWVVEPEYAETLSEQGFTIM